MTIKISSLKEKMRQALTSTRKVISEDFNVKSEKTTNGMFDRAQMMLRVIDSK